MKYSELSDKEILNEQEMFEVKGGYVCYGYGCEKMYVRSIVPEQKIFVTRHIVAVE